MSPIELFHTTNLKAATALVTLGFEMNEQPVTRTVRDDGNESTVFWFKPKNAYGLSAHSVYHGMTKGGEALNASDPDNVVNYLRSYAANRDAMVSMIRGTPRNIIVTTNGRSISISENASQETRTEIANLI